MRVFDTDFDKNADQLQEEGRAIAERGGYVYRIHKSQIEIMVEYQIPFLLIEPIPSGEPELAAPRAAESPPGGDRDGG